MVCIVLTTGMYVYSTVDYNSEYWHTRGGTLRYGRETRPLQTGSLLQGLLVLLLLPVLVLMQVLVLLLLPGLLGPAHGCAMGSEPFTPEESQVGRGLGGRAVRSWPG